MASLILIILTVHNKLYQQCVKGYILLASQILIACLFDTIQRYPSWTNIELIQRSRLSVINCLALMWTGGMDAFHAMTLWSSSKP